jgi:hypothetical protein
MKRVSLLIIAGAGIALAAWYAVRLTSATSTEAVASLLPRETIFLLHVPDMNRTRDQWHDCDIYKLYREPAVQDFLRKPLSRVPRADAASRALQDAEQLEAKDIFLALTSINQTMPNYVAGFRFRGSQADAEQVIGKWRSKLTAGNPAAHREIVEYQGHKIDIVTVATFVFASAYDNHWFLVANDQDDLKKVLDRIDQRGKDRQPALDSDESYRAATAHMPASYAALFYLQPRKFAQQLQSLRAAIGSPVSPNERRWIEQIHSVCGSMRFASGKIHDVLFFGMPKIENVPTLTRSSTTLGTKDTVFYLAAVLNVGAKLDAIGQAPGVGDRIQRLFQTFTANHVTPDDWKAAFGLEVASLADWPETSHWPDLLATLPVHDMSKASKIVEAAMRMDEDSFWARTERDGVHYFSMQSPASLISISPVIALTDRIMIVGLNAKAVEAAIQRSRNSGSDLANSQTFKTAGRLAPPPTNFFTYLDTALLYQRLDTTVRPLFLMAAAFVPGVNEYLDLDKFPDSEVITKHLSPIVSSQSYEKDGYVTESAGPITLNQTGLGLAVAGFAIANDEKMHGVLGLGLPKLPVPTPGATP